MKMQKVREIAKEWGVDTRIGRSKRDIIRDIQSMEGYIPCYETKDVCEEHNCLWRNDCIKE